MSKTKIKKPEIITNVSNQWKVNTPGLFKEIVENNSQCWIFVQPLNIFQSILKQVAERAIELNDPKLNSLMLRLALYDTANPSSKDFDPEFINEYINKHG